MLELARDHLVFSFPDVYEHARVSIVFQRTLRIPDDDKTYPLPPGLGAFPIRQVDDFIERVPPSWKEHGGVMLPLFQSEALWLSFQGHQVPDHGTAYPMALKIATGKRSALTGDPWSKELVAKDYCVVPLQPWLDGYVIDGDTIRQFVAAPLGMGFTAEEQITGKADHGGIQFEVIPMKKEAFLNRFPKIERRHNFLRKASLNDGSVYSSGDLYSSQYSIDSLAFNECADFERSDSPIRTASLKPDMGLAPGGKMKQQVFEDPYDIEDWDTNSTSRCFVHLANSLVWRAITGHEPPTAPRTSADYTKAGLPWFDYYDDKKSLPGTETLKGLKGIMELGFQKGFHLAPENERPEFKSDQIRKLGRTKDEVREGKWA